MAQIHGRPSWEWLLTDEERDLLDSITSESVTEYWRACNHCDRAADVDQPIKHKDSCPVKVVKLFAQRMVASKSKST